MAKEEDYNFNDADFDESSWDDNADPFNPQESKSNNRNPVVNTGKSLLTGAGDEVKKISFYKKVLRAGLPESFGITLDNIDDIASVGQRTYSQAMRDARPMMKEVRRVAGSLNRMVPSPFQKKIDEYLKSKDKRSDISGEVDQEEFLANQGVDSVFAEQQQDDRKIENAEKLIEKVNTDDYRTNVLRQLAAINRNVTLQTENQLKIQRAWQKKSLEVQLRQLFVSRQTLEITRKGMEENSNLLRDVVKNTGLPEIAKEQQSETLARLTRERIFGAAQGKVADWVRPYFRNVGNRISKKLSGKMNDFLYSMQQSADMFDSAEEQLAAAKEMGVDVTQMGAEMAGGGLAGKAGQWAGKKIGKRINMRKADNFFRTLNYKKDVLPQILAKWGRKYSSEHYGSILGEVFGALDVPFERDSLVKAGGMANLEKDMGTVSSNERTLNALEVIIPGFLSRILQSQEMMRTGSDNVPRIVFDPQKNVFTTFKESAQRIGQNLISDDDLASNAGTLSELVKNVGGNKLTARERAKVADMLMRKRDDHTFTWSPDQILDERNNLSEKLRDKLRAAMTDRYGLETDDNGKLVIPKKGASGIRSLQDDLRQYTRYRDYSSDLLNKVKAFSHLGGMEQLLDLGVVKWHEDSQTYELDPAYLERRSNGKYKENQWGTRKAGFGGKSGNLADDFGDDNVGNGSGGKPKGPLPSTPGSIEEDEEKVGWFRGRRIGRNKDKQLIRAIRDQTEQILDAFSNMPVREVQEEQADYLSEILERLHAGITTTGDGSGSPRVGLARRAGRIIKGTAKGLWKSGAYPFRLAKFLGKKLLWRPGSKLASFAKNKVWGLAKRGYNRASQLVTDVYVNGSDGLRRALDVASLKAERYIDMNTGKVIKTFKDITGPVQDTITGEIVITQEEFDNGLLNSMGKRLRTGIIGGAKSVIRKAISLLASPVTKPYALAKKGVNLAKKFFMTPPDVYLRGQMEKPVLYGEQMYNGMYWSGTTNKPVRHLGDIDGDIYTWDREAMQKRIVLTAQQIADPGLVDSQGRPLKGFLKKWKDRLVGAKNFVLDHLNPINMFRRLKINAKKGLKAIKRAFSSNGEGEGFFKDSWNKRIYRLLYNHFSGRPLDEGLEGVGKSVGAKAAGAFSRLKTNVKDWWNSREKGPSMKERLAKLFENKKFAAMTAAIGAAWESAKEAAKKKEGESFKERMARIRDREGSWLNRLDKQRHKATDKVKEYKEKVKSFPWIPTIMTGFGVVAGVLKSIKNKFVNWGGTLFKWLPKILAAIRDSKLATSAMDMAGNIFGGRGRTAGRILKRGAGAIGRGAWNLIRHPIKSAGTILRTGGKVAGAVGRGLMTALPWVARGVFALATSPLAWAAAAAVGVGYLIYKGYKAYQGRITSVREMRLAQYGFTKDDDSDKLGKVLALEEACMKVVKYDQNGTPSLGKLNYGELLEAFGIPVTAEKTVLSWATWFTYRFRPVFLKNLMEVRRLDPKGSLLDANTSLPKGKLPAYALATRLPDKNPDGTKGPYFIEDCPFVNQSCTIGTEVVDATINKVVLEYKNDAKKLKETEREDHNLPNVKDVAYTPEKGRMLNAGLQLKSSDNFYAPGDARANIGRITGDPDKDLVIIRGNLIDDLTAIRMKAYGMRELSKSQVNLLFRFEQGLLGKNIVVQNGTAQFVGDKTRILQEWAPAFGISLGSSPDVNDWLFWFDHRFLPVYLNFITRAVKYTTFEGILNKVRTLKADEQLSIADFMNSAKTTVNGNEVSVWTVSAYPFPMESGNTDSTVISGNLKSLRERQKEDKYLEELAKRDPKIKRDKDGKVVMDDYARKRITEWPGSGIPTGPNSAFDLGQKAGSTSINGGTGLTSYDTSGYGELADVKPNGGKAGDLPKVDAKDIASIPGSRPEARYAKLKPLFDAVSKSIGVDPAALIAFAMQESTFNPLARAAGPGQTAAGLFQFIDSTWKGYIPKLKQYGFSDPQVTDPAANTVAAAMFMRDNMNIIKKATGRVPTIPELYMAHFLGPYGASKALTADGAAPINSVVTPQQYAANEKLFAGNNIQTVADFKKWVTEKAMRKGIVFASKYSTGGISSVGTASPVGPSPTEAGSIVNGQQMGTPSSGGSVPATGAGSFPQSPGAAPAAASPAPVSNADALRAELPKAKGRETTPQTTGGVANEAANARAEVDNQRKVVAEKKVEDVQAQRVSEVTQRSQQRDIKDMADTARSVSEYRQAMLSRVQNIDKVLSDIYQVLNGGTATANPAPQPANENKADKTKNMLIKNASSNPPVGNSPGKNLPFSTSRG